MKYNVLINWHRNVNKLNIKTWIKRNVMITITLINLHMILKNYLQLKEKNKNTNHTVLEIDNTATAAIPFC